MLIWASLVTIGWGQLVSWGGTCQKVPLIADFDITKVYFFIKNLDPDYRPIH